jgi:4-hydroxy-tetrahydrodipicolinate synthase
MAKPVCEMDAAFRRGNHARSKEIMQTLWAAMNVLESGKFVRKLKYGFELQGTPVGDCRLPFGLLTNDDMAEIRAAMQPILTWA